MAATTVDRNTPALFIERQIVLQLEPGQDIPAGVIVCTNAGGNAVNGADTAALICQGRSAHRATYANGDREIVVERGVFEFANNAGAVTQADVGKLALIVDNQTVTDAATVNNIGAGYIEQVTSTGVVISMLGGKVAAA